MVLRLNNRNLNNRDRGSNHRSLGNSHGRLNSRRNLSVPLRERGSRGRNRVVIAG